MSGAARLTGAPALPALAEAWGWRWALAGSALVAAVGVAGTFVTVPHHSGRFELPHDPSDTPAGPLGPAINRLTAYSTLMGLGLGAVSAYLPLYAVEELGMGRRAAGLAATAVGWAWRHRPPGG